MTAGAKVSHLTCRRGFEPVLDDISFQFQSGELVIIKGDNGGGKTTLLKCMAGLLRDYAGQISYDPPQVPLYIGHQPGLADGLSPLQNLNWYRALRGLAADQAAVLAALDALGMAQYARQPCDTLSAGQRQRVALARLSLESALCWLLDEPAAVLDDEGTQQLTRFCEHHITSGGLVCLSTHQDLQFDVPTRRLRLRSGHLTEDAGSAR